MLEHFKYYQEHFKWDNNLLHLVWMDQILINPLRKNLTDYLN